MAVDPVCKMTVDPSKTKHTSQRAGKTIYFCSAHCKTIFDKNPDKYPT
ncbi:MAG: YHS domain-containing protein [Candidatus Caldarchaeum sp.]|nr:YHS domain-containing protein [Candidatus Caldarchaeum sp.]MDW8084416.1 YHS domain-containing protein [Candidatus Caldarchaeum sp.]MDW8436291.1 YHS domain-containing protein [Candidatus Caldarchaeum sp.]